MFLVYKTLVLELYLKKGYIFKFILNTSVRRFQLKFPNSQDQ